MMQFDPANQVVQLCAKGMEYEGRGMPDDAGRCFDEAWKAASSDLERFTAAHYVARHQASAMDKLKWDELALRYALQIDDPGVRVTLPSLYLNIAKCHEDLNNLDDARHNYQLAQESSSHLSEDGYGKMIRSGIQKGLERVKV